ncbi:FAD-binding oxidoreductase [Candidatus Bathyarchaeota archaeon]|nr:FAD-binding oxidoreductase [Candidatus Bathyarchaeota archaeon]
MKNSVITSLGNIVGKSYVVTDRWKMESYLVDETAEPVRPLPAKKLALVKPVNTREISKILKFANENRIPVFPRGSGTGLVGGAVPTENGIILTMERMNKIQIDKENLMAVAEAGVTLEKLSSSVDDSGLFFPLHPGDETAQVGGLVATNAGGARAIKYGVMRNYVKGMEIVLPTGEVLRLGGKLQKNNVGYDLMHLIIGSEGTLAVITEVILRLYPKFGATATLIVPYKSRNGAINSIPKILQDGRMPLAIEYVEKDLMEETAKHLGETWPVKEGNCYLLIIEAESSRDQMLSESLRITEICKENGSLEPLFAEPRDEQERILRIRSNIYSALKPKTADILDVTVPPAKIGKLIDAVDKISKKHDVHLPAYGHGADGNLHVHIMKKEGKGLEHIEELRKEIYEVALELKGVITGEHGIGKIRTEKLHLYLNKKELELMRKVKKIFDPNNILNPGTKIKI